MEIEAAMPSTATKYDVIDETYRGRNPNPRAKNHVILEKKLRKGNGTVYNALLCAVCGKYIVARCMTDHMKQKHPDVIFKCNHCDKVTYVRRRDHISGAHAYKGSVTAELLLSYYSLVPKSQVPAQHIANVDRWALITKSRGRTKKLKGTVACKKTDEIFRIPCAICGIMMRNSGPAAVEHMRKYHPHTVLKCKACHNIYYVGRSEHLRKIHHYQGDITPQVIRSYFVPVLKSQVQPGLVAQLDRRTPSYYTESAEDNTGERRSKARKVMCSLCEEMVRGMVQHMRDVHPDVLFQCKHCRRVFYEMRFGHIARVHKYKGESTEAVMRSYFEPVARSQVPPELVDQLERAILGASKRYQTADQQATRTLPSRISARQAAVKWPNCSSSSSSSSSRTLVLPSIRVFNCHDCSCSYSTMKDLFQHVTQQHRVHVTGKPYPYLLPVTIDNPLM